jgi:ribonuclease P protein component
MNTFTKKERLNSKKDIHRLFEQGSTFFSYPFKVYFFFHQKGEKINQASVLFSVAKKQFKLAVDRNRIKRLCRESYRLNKSILNTALEKNKSSVELAFVYVAKTSIEYDELQKKMKKILLRLAEEKPEQNAE